MRLRDEFQGLVQRLAGHRPSAEDERLVALFRNRAELKKELSALDDERHRLLDRLKLQEGATMRVEEQFAALEQYLGRAEEGYKALAYFQLKALWRAASKRLEQFAAELARQQQDRERRQQLAEFDRSKRARIADIDRELVEARVLADQLQAEQKLVWHYCRRRKLVETLATRAVRLEAAQTVVTDLSDARHEVDSEAAPTFEGLSLEGRRAVNLAIIACAESLCDRLADGGLAGLAHQTTLRRVYESDFGGQDDCLALMGRATRAAADLEKRADDLADIKARTDRLRRTVAYRGAADAIPAQDSIVPADASTRPQATPNVLLEEYFEVYSVLLR